MIPGGRQGQYRSSGGMRCWEPNLSPVLGTGVQGTGGAVTWARRSSLGHPWDMGLGPEGMNGAQLHKL